MFKSLKADSNAEPNGRKQHLHSVIFTTVFFAILFTVFVGGISSDASDGDAYAPGDTFYNGLYYKVIDENSVEVTAVPEGGFTYDYVGDLVINSTVAPYPGGRTYNVVSIGQYAFYDDSAWIGYPLTSVIIPDSVTSIGSYAFSCCVNLTSVTIGSNVKTIGEEAFSYCYSLTSVTIPDSVETIGNWAFSECYALNAVTIGNGVTDISEGAFDGCSSLISVTVGNNLTSICPSAFNYCISLSSITIPDTVEIIDDYAFNYCRSLTSVTIPDSVETIGASAFYYCSALTSVTVGNGVTFIDENAFAYCSSLISVTIGSKVETIGANAFAYCTDLTSVTIPDSVKTIEYSAFDSCGSMTSVTIGNGVTYIGDNAFYFCDALTSVTIGSKVETIGSYAFSGCISLTSITIPDNVTVIGSNLFTDCYALRTVTIGSGVTCIEDETFSECNSLVSVTIGNKVETIGNNAFINCSALTSVAIPDNVTEIRGSAFQNCPSLKTVTIGNGVTAIGSCAFYKCISLTSVTLGNEVAIIGSNAFDECYSLTSLTLPESVTTISENAFQECTSLTSLTIPSSVATIGENAFNGCYCLAEVCNKTTMSITAGSDGFGKIAYYAVNVYKPGIGSSVLNTQVLYDGSVATYYVSAMDSKTYLVTITGTGPELIFPSSLGGSTYIISDCAFNSNQSLKSAIINGGVMMIGSKSTTSGSYGSFVFTDSLLESLTINCELLISQKAFSNSDSLKTINISGDVSMNNYAFKDCDSLTSVYFNGKNISGESFCGCNKLITVVIGDNTAALGASAFENCYSLTSVTIGNNVEFIGSHAFSECNSLTSVTIGNSVENIYVYAFYRCSKLASLTIPDSIKLIDNYAFQECSSLTSVDLGNGVTKIGDYAFYRCYSLTSLTIPSTVTNIGSNAFENCYCLAEVCNKSTLGITAGSDEFGKVAYYAVNVYKPGVGSSVLKTQVLDDGSVATYYDSDGIYLVTVSGTGSVLTLPVTLGGEGYSIRGYAFYCRSSLNYVTVSTGVNSIEDNAFYGCGNIRYVFNQSMLEITAGSDEHGKVAKRASAVNFACDNGLRYDKAGTDKVSLAGYADSVSVLTIPDEIIVLGTHYAVTSISNNAFYECSDLRTVNIPSSVTSIGDYAFYACLDMKTVNISNSVVSIGNHAFHGCSSLTSLIIPSSVKTIGNNAFDGCSSLTSLTIPGSIDTISNEAFYSCNNLKSLTISNGVVSIGDRAFRGCSSLTSLTIPSSVKIIDNYAFHGCSSLTSVIIPGNVESIGDYTFSGCDSLLSVNLLDGVKSIGTGAFNSCMMSSLILPNSVEFIGSDAFSNCFYLISLTIPSSVTSIGTGAFSGCSSLTTVTLMGSPTISNDAFCDCTHLIYVFNQGTLSIVAGSDGNGKIAKYASDVNFTYDGNLRYNLDTSNTNEVLLAGYMKWPTSVSIPGSITVSDNSYAVTSIDNDAFFKCADISSVDIPSSVKSICSNAFFGCSSLVSILIPGSIVLGIDDEAFMGCSSLIKVTVDAAVPVILGEDVFKDCPEEMQVFVPLSGHSAYTADTKWNVLIICSYITEPAAAEDLVYTGEDITGVPSASVCNEYTITDNVKKDAGAYTAHVTPNTSSKSRFFWADDSIVTKDIGWKISPKSISGATVTFGQSLTYSGSEQEQTVVSVKIGDLDVTYIVSDNKATNAGNYLLYVTANGNFTGIVYKQFTVASKDISGATVTLGQSLTYNGSEQTQSVTSIKTDGLDVTCVIYNEKATDAGDYTLIAVANGNFTGTVTKQFTISPKDITDATVTLGPSLTYSGSEQIQTVVSVKAGDLPVNTYVIFDNKATDAGTYTLTVAAKGNFTGTVDKQFAVVPKDITGATVIFGPSLTYNGSEQEQSVALVLIDGLSVSTYILSDNKATDAGNYTLKVTANGNFTGTADKQFTVVPKNISGATVTFGPSLTYNGSEQTQSISSVKAGNLQVDTYSITDNRATDAGSYTLKVTANGNFTGTAHRQFSVAPKDISDASVVLGDQLTYTGSEQIQTVVSVNIGDLPVIFYSVSDNKVTDAGDYTLKVTANGNFTGTVSKQFTVAKAANDVKINRSSACIEVSYNVGAEAKGVPVFAYEIVSGSSVASVDSSGKITGLTAGKATLKISVGEQANYLPVSKMFEIDVHDHTPTVVSGIVPTETTPGLTEGSECSECQKELIKQEVIQPTGTRTSDISVDTSDCLYYIPDSSEIEKIRIAVNMSQTDKRTVVEISGSDTSQVKNKMLYLSVLKESAVTERYKVTILIDNVPYAGAMNISIPYDSSKGMPTVYQVNDDKSRQAMETVSIADGSVTFSTNHGAVYEIEYAGSQSLPSWVIPHILLAILLVLMVMIIFVIYYRKGSKDDDASR